MKARASFVALALAGGALLGTAALTACSGGTHSGGNPSTPSTFVPTRWWANTVVTAGSTIDPKHPDAAAASLTPSKDDYCHMLDDTLAAGKSILPGIGATDPALLTSTEAFVAELTKAAPTEVSASWKLLGPTVVALVKSGGSQTALPSVDAAAVQQAATQIAAHARAVCGVDLSGKKASTSPSGSPSSSPSTAVGTP